MKKLFPLVLLLSLMSCDEVLIENNSRIQIKGSLISPENSPVPDIQILSAGTFENYLSQDTNKILGRETSGEDGLFDFISLDTYSHDLLIAVNPEEIDHNSEYSSLYFFDPSGDHSKLYDLGQLELAKRIEFQFKIERTSQTQDTLRYVLQYERPVKRFMFENGSFVEQPASDGNFISIRRHLPESDPVMQSLPVMEGTEFVFSYSLGDAAVERIVIPVSVENNSYEFEY